MIIVRLNERRKQLDQYKAGAARAQAPNYRVGFLHSGIFPRQTHFTCVPSMEVLSVSCNI